MSLNRYESMLLSYLENHLDEKDFWRSRVIETANRKVSREQSARDLSAMFWEYFEERSRHESPFREVATREGLERISMLNLSEYLMRLWAPPPSPKKRA